MPKKPNFLGGQQNYNKSTGEYEPNLVGPNGKVVTDADGDGISHEKSKDKELISKYKGEHGSHRGWTDIDKDSPESKNGLVLSYDSKEKALQAKAELEKDGVKVVEVAEEYTKPGDKTPKYVVYTEDERKEHDFNDPSEAEHNKAKERDWGYEKEYEADMARRDERIKSYSKEDGIDDMKTAASYLANNPHEFEELSSELVDRIDNVKDKGKLEDIIFENLQIGDSYEEAVENALENFKEEKSVPTIENVQEKETNKSKRTKWAKDGQSATSPNGTTLKVGDKVGDDYVTGFDKTTNTIFLDEDPNVDGGRDYSIDEIFEMVEEEKQKSAKPEFLSKEHLDQLYEQAGGDEDEITDLIRASKEYKTSEMTNSDLQGVVEAYMDKKTGKSLSERYGEKLGRDYLKEQKASIFKKPEKSQSKENVVTYGNSGEFLKKHGLDKYFEFDGMDLVDKEDMSTTAINFGRNGKSEEQLLDEIKKYYPKLKFGESNQPIQDRATYGKMEDLDAILDRYEEILSKGGQLSPKEEETYRRIEQRMANMRKYRG